jgi:hypothetical protein
MVKDIELDDNIDLDYTPDDDRRDSYFPQLEAASMARTMSFEPESQIQPHRPMQRLHTAKLLEMILKDTQSRLVYRSQAIIKNDVSGYYPKGNDLDYPAKIQSGKYSIVTACEIIITMNVFLSRFRIGKRPRSIGRLFESR